MPVEAAKDARTLRQRTPEVRVNKSDFERRAKMKFAPWAAAAVKEGMA